MKLVGESLENIGASIPINYYKIISKDLDNKIIYRPNLLFTYNNTNKDLVKQITNNKLDYGIIVAKIFDNSPFKNTDIKKDTLITEINNIKLDNYGLSYEYKWIGSSINIKTIVNKFKNNDTIDIKYFNDNKLKKIKVKLTPYIEPIRMMFPIFEKIEYFILGGIIFMNLSINHIINNKEIIKLKCSLIDEDFLLKPKIIISFIAPNSKISILNNIKEYDFIKKINDIEVNNINELKNVLNKFIIINNKKYIKIEEENGKSILILLKDILNEDISLSELYKYPFSNFHKKYIKNIN
jgi:hypothetical protein